MSLARGEGRVRVCLYSLLLVEVELELVSQWHYIRDLRLEGDRRARSDVVLWSRQAGPRCRDELSSWYNR